MKRQRYRSEEYRARRWRLKAKRRQRRDPDGSRGIFAQEDQAQLEAQNFAQMADAMRGKGSHTSVMTATLGAQRPDGLVPVILQEGETRVDMNTMKEAP